MVFDPNTQIITLLDSDGRVVSTSDKNSVKYAGNQVLSNWSSAALAVFLPRIFQFGWRLGASPQGLIGKDFEGWLTKMRGGKGSFMANGRDFDGGVGNTWWEAKSGQYWDLVSSSQKSLIKFKSDMGARLKIANDNGKSYQLHSNTPIPTTIKTWLDKKGIYYQEHLD